VSSLTTSIRPPLLHSLVDSFLECRKEQVKRRLRDSMEAIVDDLFGELVVQVKDMLGPVVDQQKQSVIPLSDSEPTKDASPASIVLSSKAKSPKAVRQFVAVKSLPRPTNGTKRPLEAVANSPMATSSDGVESNVPAKKHKMATDEELFIPEGNTEHDDEASSVPTVEQQDSGDKVLDKYVCQSPGCGKRFKKSNHLKDHERIHSGAKPFLCKYPNCSYADKQRSHAISHIRKVHLKHSPDDDPKKYLEVDQDLLK